MHVVIFVILPIVEFFPHNFIGWEIVYVRCGGFQYFMQCADKGRF